MSVSLMLFFHALLVCLLYRIQTFFTLHDVQIDKTLWIHVFLCTQLVNSIELKRNEYKGHTECTETERVGNTAMDGAAATKKLKLEEKRVQRLSGVIKYPNAASFASGNKQKQQRITALQL